MNKDEKYKRKPNRQHRDVLLEPQYRHREQAGLKSRLFRQQEQEFEQELKEYMNDTR